MSGLASHMCLLRANFARCAGYLQTNTEKSEQIRTLVTDNLEGNESEPVRFSDATVIISRAAIIRKHPAGALGSEASLYPARQRTSYSGNQPAKSAINQRKAWIHICRPSSESEFEKSSNATDIIDENTIPEAA